MGVFFQYSKRKPNHLRIWKETCFTHLPFPLSGPRFPVLKWRLKSKAPLPIPNPPLKILCLSSHQIPSFSFLSVFSELQRYNSKRKRPAMAVSNNIIAILNFLALLCSIPIIGTGIWLASKPDNECVHYFRWPVVLIGVLILLVSLAGFVGAYWNRQCLLAFYIFCMAVLIVLLLALLVLAFVVTRPDGSYVVPRRGYKEYRLEGFSSWLRSHVTGSANWGKIRTCLANSNVCSKLSQDYITVDQFFMAHISPLQSGCCKPPTACGYGYVNPTMWVNPINPTADADCYMWSNDQSQLCYGCNACKAGLLGNLRKEWRKANVILIAALVALIWVYLIACSAFKNAQTEDLFQRYKQGWA